jgi:hypothetical protein
MPVAVADARRADPDEHLSFTRGGEVESLDLEGLAGFFDNGGLYFHIGLLLKGSLCGK